MKNYLSLALVLMAFNLAACGRCEQGAQGPAGPAGPAGAPAPSPGPTVTAEEQDVLNLVADENDYRESLGQTQLSNGLSCSVQQVASGQWLSSSSPGYNAGQGVVSGTGSTYTFLYKGAFNQPDTAGSNVMNVLPTALQPMFQNKNFTIRCSGYLVVTESGYYGFDLTSDDGSILTVDGSQVINNDGNHGMVQKVGSKLLRRGVRSFQLLYAQTGSGNLGLVLLSGGAAIPGARYYH